MNRPHSLESSAPFHGLQPGDQLTCRVLRIDTDFLRVQLTADLPAGQRGELREAPLDAYYQAEPEPWETKHLAAQSASLAREQRARRLAQRSIFSPFYRCVDSRGAAAELAALPAGSCLFRPSPEGPAQLLLTVKVESWKRWNVAGRGRAGDVRDRRGGEGPGEPRRAGQAAAAVRDDIHGPGGSHRAVRGARRRAGRRDFPLRQVRGPPRCALPRGNHI